MQIEDEWDINIGELLSSGEYFNQLVTTKYIYDLRTTMLLNRVS